MKICIVGAGVAGLQAADYFCKEHECHIFESSEGLGGVWRENYEGYALQVPSELYEFCGFPADVDGTFPDGKQVQDYIERWVKKENLMGLCKIHFNERVKKLHLEEDNTWTVDTSCDLGYKFDYLVICTGMYSDPYIPPYLTKFNPIHTSKFLDASVTTGRDVKVIGGGKSAIDCAVAASKYADSVSILMRELHWPIPRLILGLVPFKYGTYSRLGHFLLPTHWNLTAGEKYWHGLLNGVKSCVWGVLEFVFRRQFHMKLTPPTHLDVDTFSGGQILTNEYRDIMESGAIKRVVTKDIESNINEGDMVIAGTGFNKNYDIFEPEVRERLDFQDDGLWLYKNILPVDVPSLAFIGSGVSTFNNILTQNLQVRWLSNMFSSNFLDHDDKTKMSEYVENEREWKRSWMAFSKSRASLMQLHMTKYHDILMDDMHKEKVNNKWYQWIFPITAKDFN